MSAALLMEESRNQTMTRHKFDDAQAKQLWRRAPSSTFMHLPTILPRSGYFQHHHRRYHRSTVGNSISSPISKMLLLLLGVPWKQKFYATESTFQHIFFCFCSGWMSWYFCWGREDKMTQRMEHLISKTMNGALNRHKKQHFRAKNLIRVLHIYKNISDVESLLLLLFWWTI